MRLPRDRRCAFTSIPLPISSSVSSQRRFPALRLSGLLPRPLMASISGICPSSPAIKSQKSPLVTKLSRRDLSSVPITPAARSHPPQSIARDISAGISPVSDSLPAKSASGEKDPVRLWHRYVDWLYQHKELGVYLDVSRIGFSEEFFERMEHRMQRALAAMQELEKGAISNPDEGRMVGHYWLRNSALAPNSFLRSQIEKALDAVCEFADRIVNAEESSNDKI